MKLALLTLATVTEPEDFTLGFITLIGGILGIMLFFAFISKWL